MRSILEVKNRVFKKRGWSTIFLVAFLAAQQLSAQSDGKNIATGDGAIFSNFSYAGKDPVYNKYPLKANEFYSPILQGCYPDPSITRKGDDYYLVNSSFAMFPGVPIFRSKDLVNWKQIGHVLDRESQLKVQSSGISAGIYAPDIAYNKFNDTFYMITTQIASGIGNMVVKTKDPAADWSDPIKLNFDGIDPALFFDDDGKAYVVHNDAPVKAEERYEGHRVIKIWAYDLEKDQVVAGTDQVIVNGGVDIYKKPIWIEGPHIYKKNGKYFLMCAEGGTGDNHSEVVFTSDNVKGPYIPASQNPILSQRHLPKDRSNKVDWAGHADLVEGPDGQYYGVFLGIRPNVQNRVNIGRETFILPVDWSGEFPLFENGMEPLSTKLTLPKGVQNLTGKSGFLPNGNFVFTDKFNDDVLDPRWIALRGPREHFSETSAAGLRIKAFESSINDVAATSTLFIRQQHNDFETSVDLDFDPSSENEIAGITCLQSEKFHYVLGVVKQNSDRYIVLERTEKGHTTLIEKVKINKRGALTLQVRAAGDVLSFAFAEKKNTFKNVGGKLSSDILSTNVAGGFTGALIGLYASKKHKLH